MENNKVDSTEDDASKYFTHDEWNNLNPYEKVRIQNTYEIYVEMTKSGFTMATPDFMLKRKIQPETHILKNKRQRRTRTETSNDLDSENNKSRKRYPKRSVPSKNYKEEEIIPDDYYIYCDICMNEFVDKCNIHEQIFLPDNPVPSSPNNPNRARETVPHGWLNVSSSKIYNGGEGVWALKKIKMGIRFGPYEGVSEDAETSGEYSWQIKRDGKVICYIDGQDTSQANWMRYVNCARNKSEQNLMAYQYRARIYYRAIADISPGTELLVFYGPQFAKELGIDTKNFNSPPLEPLKDNIFDCKVCHLAFSSPIYLEHHTARCNQKKNNITDKKVSNKKRDDNVTSNNNNESFRCHLCSMIYTIKSLYDYHLIVKHCVYNGNQEPTRNNEDTPADSNSTSNDSGCNDELKNQNTSSKRRFKCNECHKAFTAPNHLEKHSRVHSGERPFKCQTCTKTFTTADSLKRHTLIHTGERPYECDVCHTTFNTKGHLITHKRIHDNVRPYQCSHCNQTFTDCSNLSAHTRVHTGEKPYHCHMCTYKSTQAGALKTHIRTHTGEKPYTCQHCHKTFSNSSHLNKHKRTQHRNEQS